MTIRTLTTSSILATTLLLAAGCGGDGGEDGAGTGPSSITPQERVEACLTQQPDATRAECEEWEQDDQLANDGTHEEHESAAG